MTVCRSVPRRFAAYLTLLALAGVAAATVRAQAPQPTPTTPPATSTTPPPQPGSTNPPPQPGSTTPPPDSSTTPPPTSGTGTSPLSGLAERLGAGGGGTSGTPTGGGAASNTTATNRAADAPTSATGSSVTGAAGQAGAALNANTAGDLLNKSASSVGVEVQRRNAIVSDPRVRGYRNTQYLTVADGGAFIPARLDLDTAASKFDPSTIRDIVVVKGPYNALYGPGFAFFDIATLPTPRSDTFDVRGRTSSGYQTNGRRVEGLQSVAVSDRDWGFRTTYNILQGNDYRSGSGIQVPASYLSQNFNFALGADLTPNSSIEFKGLRVFQHGLEFPGLYFDINQLDTEAYSLRYVLRDQVLFDRFTLDVWYNSTATTGDTAGANKQAFVQKLLAVSFNPQIFRTAADLGRTTGSLVGDPTAALFQDFSDTRFASRSIGYRAATSWGVSKDQTDPLLTVGTDLNAFGQGLVENIRFQQIQGPNLNTGLATSPAAPGTFFQQQSIPNANQVDAGIFFQSALPLTDRLKVRTGGRLDWVDSSANPRRITGNVDLFGPPRGTTLTPSRFDLDPIVYSSNPGDNRLTRDYLLPMLFLQTEYKLDDNWTAQAAVGHAHRAPTLTELYASGPFIGVLQQGTSRLIGDPNLSPEKLTQFDLGLRAEYEMFQFGVTGFYALINDYITYDANRSGLGLTQVVYTNTDLAALAGAETFTQANLTPWLTSFGNLSYVQGTDLTARDHRRPANLASSRRDDPATGQRKAATEPLPLIPPVQSRLGLRFHQPTADPWWQIEFSTLMMAGQNNVAASLGELPTPGFTVFNVRGFLRVSQSVLLTAGVENIGNKNYREHIDPISGNLLQTGYLFRPGTNFYFNTQITY